MQRLWMTQEAIDECRVALQNTRAELAYRNISRDDITVESAADSMDQTAGLQEREMAIGGMDRISRRLRDVRLALARMEGGTFGVCLDCEADISPKRLVAVPWAELCITCQEKSDGAAAAYGAEIARDSMTEAA